MIVKHVFVLSLILLDPLYGNWEHKYHFDAHPTKEQMLFLLKEWIRKSEALMADKPELRHWPDYRERLALIRLVESFEDFPQVDGKLVGTGFNNSQGKIYLLREDVYSFQEGQ